MKNIDRYRITTLYQAMQADQVIGKKIKEVESLKTTWNK